jgi:hypothetical protein
MHAQAQLMDSMNEHHIFGLASSASMRTAALFPLALRLGRHRLEVLELGLTRRFAQLSVSITAKQEQLRRRTA